MKSVEQTVKDLLINERELINLKIKQNIINEIDKCCFKSPMSEYDLGVHEGLMLALKVCNKSEGSYKVIF